jgi:hypothetical protein
LPDNNHTRKDIEIILGTRLISCLLNHREQKTTVASPALESSNEIFASLRNGHLVESLSLMLIKDELSINLTLHATDFSLTQCKIKNNYEDQNLEEQDKSQEEIFLRCAALDDAEGIINDLFERWLSMRLSTEKYSNELARMRAQIADRLESYSAHDPTTSSKLKQEAIEA